MAARGSPTAAGMLQQSAAVGRRRTARLKEPQYSHAPAYPAAEAISDRGRPQRRSAKNRRTFSISREQSRTRSSSAEARKRLRKRTFDCFKSAEGIRFREVARPTPKSFHRGGFWRYLLCEQKVTYKTIKEACDSLESRGPQPRRAEARCRSRKLTRALRRLPLEHLRRKPPPATSEDKFRSKSSACGSEQLPK